MIWWRAPPVRFGLLDILFGPFVLLGIERATVTPAVSPGFSLNYIDWSHSLAMSLIWSLLFAAPFLRMGKSVAMVMSVAVFSHVLLDVPMHPPDLALWPGWRPSHSHGRRALALHLFNSPWLSAL